MASENTSPKLISSEEYAKIDFTPDNLRRIMSSDPEAAIQIILTAHSAIHNLNSELKSAREHADGLEAAWQEDTQLKDQYQDQYNQSSLECAQLRELLVTASQRQTMVSQPEPRLSKKVLDPDPFKGEKSRFDEFRTRVAIKLAANGDHYPMESHKVAYVFSLLQDKALAQVQHFFDPVTSRITCDNVATLFDALNTAFGDPYRKSMARQIVRNLRQTNKTFSDYYASFSREIGYTGYDTEAKKAALISGLSSELLGKLEDKETESLSFTELVALCQRLDSQRNLFASILKTRSVQRENKAQYTRNFSALPLTTDRFPSVPPQAPVAPFPHTIATGGDAMDLSAANLRTPLENGRLPQSERERRRQNHLCMYCGQAGHIAINCQTLQARRSASNTPLHFAACSTSETAQDQKGKDQASR